MSCRASNDTTMNITTNVDGQYLVPTGHYNEVIAKRDESDLTVQLGLRRITGKGTTVNVPIDNEDDGEFVVTSKSGGFDRDAPATTYKAMTLAMYTKKVDLTYQLLEDEDSKLMAFLADFVGRGMAKTNNGLLLTEVAANGTSLKTFASGTVIAVNELEAITYNEALSNYLDDTSSCAWVMKRAVHGEIVLLGSTSIRYYEATPTGAGVGVPSLLGFPVKYSAKSGDTATSTKSVYFGNWNYVGVREGPGFTMMRDPYTRSSYGEVILNYFYRIVYGVLQAEAIGFGVHPSANLMIRIVTGCNEGYYPRMAGWLDSLAAVGNIPYTLVKVGWDQPSGRQIDEVCLPRNLNNGAPSTTESIQHGSFLQVVDGPEDELVIYCDGDMVLQRPFTADERGWLEDFGPRTVSAGPNRYRESMQDELDLLQVLVSMDELLGRFPGAIDEWLMLNVGVVAMRRAAWRELYQAYMERWESVTQAMSHQARQQWLICYLIYALGMELRIMPYAMHSHGHFGPHPEVEKHGEDVVVNGKLAAIRHHL